MPLTITTNHQPRDLVAWSDLPANEQEFFDYVEGDDRYSQRFVEYRGSWYDVNDTISTSTLQAHHHDLGGWDSYIDDTFFSGVVFRFADRQLETVVAGHYYATTDY